MKPIAYIKDDFKNLLDYRSWLNTAYNNLSSLNKGSFNFYFEKENVEGYIRRNWYGANTSYKELVQGVTEYQRPELLDEIYRKVKDKISASLSQKLQARKLKFNALGLGMFCFDRAAMTLYRNKEFYSPSKKTKIEAQDVKVNEGNFVHKGDETKVVKRWEQKPDGSPKIRTNTKELFAYFPEVPRDRHAVEFYMTSTVPFNMKAEQMLYNGVSAVIMTELLMKAGLKVKINLVVGSISTGTQRYIGSVTPIKEYDEPLDRNAIALLSSDPRFMRYDAVKGIVAAYDHFKTKCSKSAGTPVDASGLKTILEESGYAKKSLAAHRYYFGGTFSEQAAINDINNTIGAIAKLLEK